MLRAGRAPARRTARTEGLDCGLASTTADLDAAFRLVHDQYVALGYMHPHPSGRRIGLHHSLPTTKVFVCKSGDEVIGTVSLILDSLLELPCDELYRRELAPLRAAGRRLAEVSALAVHERCRTRDLGVLMRLVHLVVAYASRIAQVDDLCITVNPRHARFYELLRFRRFGAIKPHPAVQDAPAVPLVLDLCRSLDAATATAVPRFANRLLDPVETSRLVARLEDDLVHALMSAPPPGSLAAPIENLSHERGAQQPGPRLRMEVC
jgi:hypothetical protein